MLIIKILSSVLCLLIGILFLVCAIIRKRTLKKSPSITGKVLNYSSSGARSFGFIVTILITDDNETKEIRKQAFSRKIRVGSQVKVIKNTNNDYITCFDIPILILYSIIFICIAILFLIIF